MDHGFMQSTSSIAFQESRQKTPTTAHQSRLTSEPPGGRVHGLQAPGMPQSVGLFRHQQC